MIFIGLLLAALAAAFHVFIFVLESVRWTEPATRKVFGVASEADAETTKPLAFNQGFYNLFLAIAAFLGIVLVLSGLTTVGLTLVFAGTGMMVAAALVLMLSNPKLARSAMMQGTLPLLAIIALALSVALS
jgi:putative membrane protein